MLLNDANLKEIGKKLPVPAYVRKDREPSLVHIGLGHFHRAHYLNYLETLFQKGLYEGGVFETDIMPPAGHVAHLKEQDYLYTLTTKATDGSTESKVIGGIAGYASAAQEPDVVLSKLSDPQTKLITLTITEKGYCYDDKNHTLDWTNPNVKHDVEHPEVWPRTAVGYVARALNVRYRNGKQLVTIMTCDNIPKNGVVLRSCVLGFMSKVYPEAGKWVASDIAFPCTMVDRITPGTTKADSDEIKAKFDYEDGAPVHAEDFIQWVIERKACTETPPFEKAGATMVDDIEPYELMKIRLLNGSHSALSYMAYLMGIRYVDDAVTNPLIHEFIRDRYMEEITRTLQPIEGVDFSAYKDKLISRFANVNIKDTILRLASDGTKKIANAIIKPLQEAVHRKLPYDAMIFALACWTRFLSARDEEGNSIPIEDDLGPSLRTAFEKHGARGFLQAASLTGLSEEEWKGVTGCFDKDYALVMQQGTRKALAEFLRK